MVKHFFGHDWFERHVSPASPVPGFLRIVPGQDAETTLTAFKIVDFAELLFNLQNIEGVDICLDRMRQGNIEGTYAELDFGRMLYLANLNFRYVEPSGVLGTDYDIEIILPDGMVVCADAKCKIETTTFSAKSVLHTLRHARTQFPKERPSAIFVKVPPSWLDDLSVARELLTVGREFLRETGRIVSVKFYVTHLTYGDGKLIHAHVFKELSNAGNRFNPERDWDMFVEAPKPANWNGMPQRWRRLLFFPKDGPT